MAGTLVSVDNRRLAAARLAFPNDESRIPILLIDPQTRHTVQILDGTGGNQGDVDMRPHYYPCGDAFRQPVGGFFVDIDAPVQLYRNGDRALQNNGVRYNRAHVTNQQNRNTYVPLTWGELVFFRCLNQKPKSWTANVNPAPHVPIPRDLTWDHTGKAAVPYFYDQRGMDPHPVYETCDTFHDNCDECRKVHLGCKYRPATQECVERTAGAVGAEVMATLVNNQLVQGACPAACATMNGNCGACVAAAGCKYFVDTATCGSIRTPDLGQMVANGGLCPVPLAACDTQNNNCTACVLLPRGCKFNTQDHTCMETGDVTQDAVVDANGDCAGAGVDAQYLLQLTEQATKKRASKTPAHKSHKRAPWLGARRHVSLDYAGIQGLVFLKWETKADRMIGCPALDDASDQCSPAWRAANEDDEGLLPEEDNVGQCDCECAMFCSQDFDAILWDLMKREREERGAAPRPQLQAEEGEDDVEEGAKGSVEELQRQLASLKDEDAARALKESQLTKDIEAAKALKDRQNAVDPEGKDDDVRRARQQQQLQDEEEGGRHD